MNPILYIGNNNFKPETRKQKYESRPSDKMKT